jgi:hypothetical protein
VHGTEGGNPESDREPRPAELSMGNVGEGIQSPSRPTSPLRFRGWVQKGTEEGSAAHRSGVGGFRSSTSVHPRILPAKSAVLNSATNGYRERSNPRHLSTTEKSVRRMTAGEGMSPEANAPGKARGYADGVHERTEDRDIPERNLLSAPATGA